jgi:LPXTG-motif cell wall-anchored protein
MATDAIDDAQGINRRSLLKRGAVIGATAVWTIPVVQAVSVTPAHADTTSAPPTARHDSPPPVVSGSNAGNGSTVASGGALASTGEQAVAGVAIGAAALAVGAGLVAAAKRKKDNEERDGTQPSA